MKISPQSIMSSAGRNFNDLKDLLKPHKSLEYRPECKILANNLPFSLVNDPLYPSPDFHAFPYSCYEDRSTNICLPLVPVATATSIGHQKYLVTAAYTSSSGVTVTFPSVWIDLHKPLTVLCPKHKGSADCCLCYAFVPAHASVFCRNHHS